jgi:eukaryotic-like serine/threonine-protein kinase
MALASGTKLGPYEIAAPLGAGGMGEVYRARDSRLGRDVAIKVLAPNLSSDPALRQRLEREARAISSLQHPHICVLHDIGHHEGIDYLVMECLEGETLANRLQKGPLPVEQVLKVGIEIADALDKAHRRGIVHRDLKPGNIMLTKSGAKLMDFGLAKPAGVAAKPGSNLGAAMTPSSPTIPLAGPAGQASPLTAVGTVVGTFQYMSPEQIEGKDADARSDIFAFGAVLYEMVTGKRAFEGKSQISVASAILDKDPPPVSTTTKAPVSPALEHVIARALIKDPEQRWQSAGDIRAELEWTSHSGPSLKVDAAHSHRWLSWLPWAVAFVAVAGLIAATAFRSKEPIRPRLVASIPPPPDTDFGVTGDVGSPPVVSPDGTRLAFGAGGRIWVRTLDSGEMRPLDGTESGQGPFWSSDSRKVGFFSGGKLRVVDSSGGSPATICDASNPRGGAWSSKGIILFAPNIRSGLYQVSANGGTPVPVTTLDAAKHSTHRWPQFLPDGDHFLYLATNHSVTKNEFSGIYVGSLSKPESRLLLRTEGSAIYASGYLLFVRKTNLMAQPLDISRLELHGDPFRVAAGALYDQSIWRGVFTVSDTGILVYAAGANSAAEGQLTWFDQNGKMLGAIGERGSTGPRLSPDGNKLLLEFGDPNQDVWIFDIARGVRTRVTTSGDVFTAIWSSDGRNIAYPRIVPNSSRTNITVRPADGSNGENFVHEENEWQIPSDWSPDGKYILYNRGDPGATDIYVMPVAAGEKPFPFVQTPAWERDARFSPDGHWVAFTSRESGRDEIYISPFPGPGTRWQISSTGASDPRWRRDGKAVFAINRDDVLQFPITATNGTIQAGEPTVLFHTAIGQTALFNAAYDVTPDGRFLLNSLGKSNSGNRPLTIVANWAAGLEK